MAHLVKISKKNFAEEFAKVKESEQQSPVNWGSILEASTRRAAPESRDPVSEIGYSLRRGTRWGLPEMAGHAARWFGAEELGGDILRKVAHSRLEHPEWQMSKEVEARPWYDPLKATSSTVEMLPPLAPGLLTGVAAITAGLPATAAMAIGLGTSGLLYGGSRAGDVEERALKAGKTPEEAESLGWKAGTIEGGLEIVSEALPLGAILRPLLKAPGKKAVGSLIKNIVTPSWKQTAINAAKSYGKIAAVEVPTEMAQESWGMNVEEKAGLIEPGHKWEATKQVILPTAILSAFFAGGGTIGGYRTRRQISRALSDINVKPEVRKSAVGAVSNIMRRTDETMAAAFEGSANAAIDSGLAIPLNDSDLDIITSINESVRKFRTPKQPEAEATPRSSGAENLSDQFMQEEYDKLFAGQKGEVLEPRSAETAAQMGLAARAELVPEKEGVFAEPFKRTMSVEERSASDAQQALQDAIAFRRAQDMGLRRMTAPSGAENLSALAASELRALPAQTIHGPEQDYTTPSFEPLSNRDKTLFYISTGQPFLTEAAARLARERILKKEEIQTVPVKIESGWVLKRYIPKTTGKPLKLEAVKKKIETEPEGGYRVASDRTTPSGERPISPYETPEEQQQAQIERTLPLGKRITDEVKQPIDLAQMASAKNKPELAEQLIKTARASGEALKLEDGGETEQAIDEQLSRLSEGKSIYKETNNDRQNIERVHGEERTGEELGGTVQEPIASGEEIGAGRDVQAPKSEKEVPVIATTPSGDVKVEVPLLQKEAKTLTPKQQKQYLFEEIDKAIEAAPNAPPEIRQELALLIKGGEGKQQAGRAISEPNDRYERGRDAAEASGFIEIHVPGDGVFKVYNYKEALEVFKERAKAFPESLKTAKTKGKGLTKIPKLESLPRITSSKDVEVTYRAPYKKRNVDIKTFIKKAEEAHQNFYGEGWWSDTKIALKIKELKGNFGILYPRDVKTILSFSEGSLQPASDMEEGIFADAGGNAVLLRNRKGDKTFIPPGQLDLVFKHYPDAKLFVHETEPMLHPVVAFSNKEPVALIMPIVKPSEQYSIGGKFGGTVSHEDIQIAFPTGRIFQQTNGDVLVALRHGRSVLIKSVDNITPNEISFTLGYGRTAASGEAIAGVYGEREIRLAKGLGDKWVLAHESIHFMEDTGVFNTYEIGVLKHHAKDRIANGKQKGTNPEDVGGQEDRANLLADLLTQEPPSGVLGRIVAKIQEWVDRFVNLFHRTTGGIVRGIKSGAIYERTQQPQQQELEAAYSTLDPAQLAKAHNVTFDGKWDWGAKQYAFSDNETGASFSMIDLKDFEATLKGVRDDFKRFQEQYSVQRQEDNIRQDIANNPEIQFALKEFEKIHSDPAYVPKNYKGILKWMEERFGAGYISKDKVTLFNRMFSIPMWLGKKFPNTIGKAFEFEEEAREKRNSILYSDYEDSGLREIQDKVMADPNKMSAFKNLVWNGVGAWTGEGARMPKTDVPTDWYQEAKEGDYTVISINEQHYREVEEFLKRNKVDPEIIKGFVTVRHKLDEKLIVLEDAMRTNKVDPELIEEYRSAVHKIHNYFPHQREGDSYVRAVDSEGNVLFREHYYQWRDRLFAPVGKKARDRAQAWIAAKAMPGLKIEQGENKNIPDELFFQIPVENMQQLLKVAGGKLNDSQARENAEVLLALGEVRTLEEGIKVAREKLGADMENALTAAFSDVLKGRGFGQHAIMRSEEEIAGYETEDIFGILHNYLSGHAGFITKMERARHHSGLLMSMQVNVNPTEYTYLSRYVRDALSNRDKVDRFVDTLRGAAFVKYLGFVVKGMFVQLTQNVILAAPILSMHTKGSHVKLGKAMADVRQAMTSMRSWRGEEVRYKNLSTIERRVIHDLHQRGATMDQYLRELQGNLSKLPGGKQLQKFVRASGMFMSIGEKMNRTSTGLAAFRIAYNEGTRIDGESTKGNYDLSLRFVRGIINRAHFAYGKHNLPEIFRGGDPQKLLRSAYTLRSFTWNYLSALYDLLTRQGRPGKLAFARSIRNSLVIGGVAGGVPLANLFLGMVSKVLDKDDEDALTQIRKAMPERWMRDLVTYGLPGLGGIDISGSIALETPTSWKELIGIPYAPIDDFIKMKSSWESGQKMRAAGESPITPIAIRNALAAVRLLVEGQRTRGGKDINYAGEVGARKISPLEALGKGVVGVQPVSVSSGYKAAKAISGIDEYTSKIKTKLADRFVNALRSKDEAEMQQVWDEVNEWNKKVMAQNKVHLFIDLRAAIKNRLAPAGANIPKLQRQEAQEISQAWR